MKKDATDALEEKYFRPVITQSSPSRTARVAKTRGTAPPCGSVIEKQKKIAPDSSLASERSLCSSAPKRALSCALPVSGAWVPNTMGAHRPRPRDSTTERVVKLDASEARNSAAPTISGGFPGRSNDR